jgi:hypothetical protein
MSNDSMQWDGSLSDAEELALRRRHVDPLTRLPGRLPCLQWLEVDDNAWSVARSRGLLLIDLDMFRRQERQLAFDTLS